MESKSAPEHKKRTIMDDHDGVEESGHGASGMMSVACIVENRAREVVVAVARSYRSVEVFTLADGPSYTETTDLLSELAPEEILLNGSSCQGNSRSLLCRKIEKWRDGFAGHPNIRPISRAYFDQDRGADFLRQVSMTHIDSEVLARYTVLGAAFALLKYIESATSMTFPRGSVKLHFIDSSAADFLTIDRRTAMGLEILANARSGDQKNCLFGKIDHTKTNVGATFLRQQLLRPSASVETIKARQDAAIYLVQNEDVLSAVVQQLQRLPDLNRMLNRLVSIEEGKLDARVIGGNIKTIISIKHTFAVMGDLVTGLHMHDTGERRRRPNAAGCEDGAMSGGVVGEVDDRDPSHPDLIDALTSTLLPPCTSAILEKITSVITESTSFSKSSLGAAHQECFAVTVGVDGMLDVARKTYLQTVEEVYAEAESLASEYDCLVNVHYTHARGYHLKLPGTLAALPDERFIQCVKSPRFIACTTKEVASLSDRAHEAIQEALSITDRITQGLLVWLQGFMADLFAQAESVALLDMLVSFAELNLTSTHRWCTPTVRESGPLVIKQGRHPILAELPAEHGKVVVGVPGDAAAADDVASGAGFVPNDTFMDNISSLHVVSGVNGSGKTTYLKQVALIVVLAQVGCFVPAEECFLPVRNRLLSRIGSGDDIENNLSTFLMEMKDAAYICKHSGDRSLVLVDELGRGTANRDGSAIAWAVAEVMLATSSNLCCFVTHYPLLLNLATVYPTVKNVHMAVNLKGGKLSTYRHTLTAGASVLDTDYGIDLAERMGVDQVILKSAREIKSKILEAAPPNMDEARTGGDLGRMASTLKLLLRRLSSLKGASIDDKTLRSYLDKVKAELTHEQQVRLRKALQVKSSPLPSAPAPPP